MSATRQAAASPPPAVRAVARTAIYALGTVLFLASLVFVGLRAASNWRALTALDIPLPGALVVSAVLYGASHASTGLAWPLALRRLGERISLVEGLRIGLVAQIGKYLPGNVAHYLGRGALARTAGVPLKTSSLSTAVELVSAVGAAIIVSVILTLVDPRPLAIAAGLTGGSLLLASLLLLLALVFGIWIANRDNGVRLFLAPIGCLAVSLLLSGLSFAALLAGLGFAETPVTLVITAVSIAWVAGFLVPGAPAGLGIREAVLVASLSPEIGVGAAVAAAMLHRLITAAVDVIAALGGYAWVSRSSFSKK